MKKFIALIMTLIPISGYADSYQLFNFNKFTCDRTSSYEYNVCIKNNTGNDITPKQMSLNYVESDNDGGSGGGGVPFSIWKANSYIMIEVSRKFFTPEANHYPRNEIKFYLSKEGQFERLPGCNLAWTYLNPPYSVPATLVLERNGNDYYCHYQ